MTATERPSGSKVAAGYAAMVADFVVASEALKRTGAGHATTLAAAYGAFAAGYVAASAAADQAGAVNPFPLLPLPDAGSGPLPDVLTLPQAASYLQLPEHIVRAEAEAGGMPGRVVGSEWRFSRDGLLSWLRPSRPPLVPPRVEETEEEFEAFMARIRASRDETDRLTGHGKYAPDE